MQSSVTVWCRCVLCKNFVLCFWFTQICNVYYADNFMFEYVTALNWSYYFPRAGEPIGSPPSWSAEVHYRVPGSPSSAVWIHSTLFFSKIPLMLHSHLRLGHQRVLFTRCFPTSHFPHACYISDQSNRSWLSNISVMGAKCEADAGFSNFVLLPLQ